MIFYIALKYPSEYCMLVYLYYNIFIFRSKMKILASSPYAPFNVKEWHSLTRSCMSNKRNSKNKLEVKSLKNFQKYNPMKSREENIEEPKIIQLSFA